MHMKTFICNWVKRYNKFSWVVGALSVIKLSLVSAQSKFLLLIQYHASLQIYPVPGQLCISLSIIYVKIDDDFVRSCLYLNIGELYPSLGWTSFLINNLSFKLKFYRYLFMFLKLFLLECRTVGRYNWDC